MSTCVVTAEAAKHLSENPEDARTLRAVALSFRAFLDHWHFVDLRTGKVEILGQVLWAAQEEFVRMIEDPDSIDPETGRDWIFFLKARKLGETTIECAYDAWCARFRDGAVNARVHLFSKKELDAIKLLRQVKYGMKRLPWWMQLPVGDIDTQTEWSMRGGPEDTRYVAAYPSDKETAIADTCQHGHVDEWARMGDPSKVWQAIEPTMAGSCHIVTTGLGPTNYSSEYYKRCQSGDARHRAVFIHALTRPDRNQEWLRKKILSMDDQARKQEYPMTWTEALSGGGDSPFKSTDIDHAGQDFRGLGFPAPGRVYVIAADIGRHADAAVITTLDVSEEIHDVVGYDRLREAPYPVIQSKIKERWQTFHGPAAARLQGITGDERRRWNWIAIVVIEGNSAGEAVIENLDIPEDYIIKWTTTKPSKARLISAINVAIQNQLLKWDPRACEQLDNEVRGYQVPDDNVVQDSVISLGIAEEHAAVAHQYRGGSIGVIRW